jgi:nitric oxide dioxygenase
MTPAQITLVEDSHRLIAPIAEPAAAIFYERLFALDPALRALFAHADPADQQRKLMAAIGFVVANLRRPWVLMPAVVALGTRHVGYGVQPGHYETVSQALMETLAEGLGPAFTPPVREAWRAAYGLLAGVMRQAEAPQAA